MSGLDWLILVVLAVLFVCAIRYCWRRRGKCCGDCSACRNCSSCRKNQNPPK